MKIGVPEAVATVVGMIIGAGILGIPYVISEAGFLTGILIIIFLGAVVTLLYLYMGEIILRTHGDHQLSGYAEKYLGKTGKLLMTLSFVVLIYGALTAYLIGEGQVLSTLLGGNYVFYMLVFFVFAAALVYAGLKTVGRSELVMNIIMVFIILVIIGILIPHIKAPNLAHFNITKFFIPFGVILFSLLGLPALPEAKELLKNKEKYLKKVIIISMSIVIFVYILFAAVVVGSVGPAKFAALSPNERIATVALGNIAGSNVFLFANIFAVVAMATSFLAVALASKEMFVFDFKLNHKFAWFLTCFIPLGIALSNVTNFIQVMSIVGIIIGIFDVVLVVAMAHRAKRLGKRKPEYQIKMHPLISAFLIAVFLIAVLRFFLRFLS